MKVIYWLINACFQWWRRKQWKSIPEQVDWLMKQNLDLRIDRQQGVVFAELRLNGHSYRGVGLSTESATLTALHQMR